jgi:hypothetical protein
MEIRVVCVYDSRSDARAAERALKRAGFRNVVEQRSYVVTLRTDSETAGIAREVLRRHPTRLWDTVTPPLDLTQGDALGDHLTQERESDEFYEHFEEHYASLGGIFEDYSPAYQFGSRLAQDRRFARTTWRESERDFRAAWEVSSPGRPWERFKGAIREGWRRATNTRG